MFSETCSLIRTSTEPEILLKRKHCLFWCVCVCVCTLRKSAPKWIDNFSNAFSMQPRKTRTTNNNNRNNTKVSIDLIICTKHPTFCNAKPSHREREKKVHLVNNKVSSVLRRISIYSVENVKKKKFSAPRVYTRFSGQYCRKSSEWNCIPVLFCLFMLLMLL